MKLIRICESTPPLSPGHHGLAYCVSAGRKIKGILHKETLKSASVDDRGQ